jgi:hypothetical protein
VQPSAITAADAGSIATALLTYPLAPTQVLQPGGSRRGLYLSCWVLPPASGAAVVPVVMLDAGGAQAGQWATAQAGLRLQPAPADGTVPGSQPAGWCAVGWVTGAGSTPVTTPLTGAGAMPGGQWSQVGLLFDGTTLSIWINGVQRAASASGVAGSLVSASGITIGELIDPAFGTGTIMSAAILDDIDYELVGTDQLGTLPDGIAPAQATRVTVAPDGSMTATVATVDGSIVPLATPWAQQADPHSTGAIAVTTLQGLSRFAVPQSQPAIELLTYRDGVMDLSDMTCAIIPVPTAAAPTPDGGRGYLATWGLESDGVTRIPVVVPP